MYDAERGNQKTFGAIRGVFHSRTGYTIPSETFCILSDTVTHTKRKQRGYKPRRASDLVLDYGRITTIYKKRWNVEVFHKSIKSNTGLARSPTHTVRTQSNHFFASIYAFFKLELLKVKHQLNHFALRSKLYIKALQASFAELQRLTA